MVVSTKPRWLRHMTATLEPWPTPASRSACASAFVRRWSPADVGGPRAAATAVAAGGGGVRAAVDLGERERAEVVDDRRRGRVADRADGVASGRRGAEAVQREHGLRDLVRARRRRDARADQRLRREQLLQDAIRDVHGPET